MSTTPFPRSRRVEAPDRLDLDAKKPFMTPLWRSSATEFLRLIVTGKPAMPDGAKLAPSPKAPDPLLGHLRLGRGEPLTFFTRWQHEHGDIVRLRLAGITAHLIGSPRLARYILQEENKRFSKPIQGRRNLSEILGNGLLVAEGNFWLRQRRIAQPAFHKKRIDGFGESMVDASEALADTWDRRGDQSFDVARDMMHLTLRIVQETLLGTTDSTNSDAIGDAVTAVLEEVESRFRRLFRPPPEAPLVGNPKFVAAVKLLDDTVQTIIDERRRSGVMGNDLLSMLLEARDEETGEGMDDRQLRDEVMTMFLAGHETTANALSWTFYLLGQHLEVADRMREELFEVLGDRRATAADMRSLPYTKAVFQEAMRLYPPAWIMARAPVEDEVIDGYFVPAGSRMFISPWVLHRNPDVWENPLAFDPRRFLGKPPDRFAYMPFGGGPRLCIGNAFAMMEGVLVLATLGRRAKLELIPGHPVEPEPLVTLRPKHGVHVRARKVTS
ncbi:MAG: cytochrome P450 [Sandaracinaceae bacterium]